jgi:hypothetical protein
MNRQVFDKDFKRSTVQMMIEQNKPVAQTARVLDINPNTLHNWKKKYSSEFIRESLPQLTDFSLGKGKFYLTSILYNEKRLPHKNYETAFFRCAFNKLPL